MALLRYDDFNRTDDLISSNLGNPSDGGAAWARNSTGWGIKTNSACQTSGGFAISYLEASNANVSVEATMAVAPTNVGTGVCARVQDGSNYIAFFGRGGSNYRLWRVDSGAETVLGTYTSVPTANDVLKLELNGDSITAYLNGSPVIGPITETTYQTNTKHGLFSHTEDSNGGRLDDFAINSIGGGSPTGAARTTRIGGLSARSIYGTTR